MMRLISPETALNGRSFARLLVTGFVLLAFLLQSNATQTHIHFLPDPAALTAAKTVAAADTAHATKQDNVGKDLGGKESPDDCPLCQLLYGGQYVAPSSLIFFLPMAAVRTIAIVAGVIPQYDSVSHSWRGRAPPRR